ncbi:MAG: sugar phosphate isomerase/epimerase, partial [Acidobacteriota bacterium]|nr:sugar phosphate isomerase/epimerase [Acidobacteriota bacterium]
STHVKDMGVEEFPDGFLLSEMPLGEGFLNLERMIAAIRAARPKTRFTLEMITRNPLVVPCLTEKYWATFPERNGIYLARTLKLVQREGHRLQALPRVDQQSRQAQLRLEDENVKICLNHAREKLSL